MRDHEITNRVPDRDRQRISADFQKAVKLIINQKEINMYVQNKAKKCNTQKKNKNIVFQPCTMFKGKKTQ